MNDGDHPIRVLLADDHNLVREAIADMLGMDPDVEVVGQAGNGAEAVALSEKTKPDVVLLDIEMPVMDARGVLARLQVTSPTSKVIILTVYDDPSLVRELLALGASSYLTKTCSSQELLSAVRSVARGEERVILSISREALERSHIRDQRGISTRELEVLLFVARGMSNGQIASALHLTEGTIKRHLHNVYAKLGVSSRGEATRMALSEGWITARDITSSDN